MRVVAIDPAPKKPSTLYDGQGFRQVPASHMRQTLNALREHCPLLLCWDAPLTGPQDPNDAGSFCDDFFIRPLDGFLRTLPPPEGISVREYAGCPHWTISRSVLGLPRLGPYDLPFDSLPFQLLPTAGGASDGAAISKAEGRFVVEIHPAVAAWLWCKEVLSPKDEKGKDDWRYKRSQKGERAARKGLQEQMWEHIHAKVKETLPTPENDDQFDALVGYVLGIKWLNGDEDVVLLGDRETGAMLLPKVDSTLQQWAPCRKELATNEEHRRQIYNGMRDDRISAKKAAALLGAEVTPATVRELMKEPEKCGHVLASGRGGKRVYTLPPSPTDLLFSPTHTPSSGVAE